MAPTPTELQRLATVISRRTGMALPSTRLPFLTARARAVMAWAGADNWDSWLSELEASAGNDDRVGEALDEALQVHETCFFRYPGKFDAIFCCNVCLYFMRPTKDQILTRLTAALRRGGYLFLGHAEGVTPPVDNFRAIHRPSGVMFQRIPA